MSKSLLELVTELTDIHEKQKDLALRAIQIRHEILKFEGGKSAPTPLEREVLSNSNGVTINPSQTWNKTMKIDKKTSNILRRNKRIMTNREVGESIAEIEKNDDPEYLKYLIRKFSAVVGGRAKNGKVFNRIEIDGDYYYGLVDWFEPNGSVKPEFGQIE